MSILFFMHPSVRFVVDSKTDWTALQGFLRDAEFDGGRNLEWAVYAKHPDLEPLLAQGSSGATEKQTKQYIVDFYTGHDKEIKENQEVYRRQWDQKQADFFRLTEGIFGQRPWPPGRYEAYATIWGMFPRSLDDKTFQVPALYENKPYVNVVVVHEMLHFMFYGYFFEQYPQYKNEEHNFLTWNVSEIFNAVVQNSRDWLAIFGLKTMTYPEHETIEANLRSRYPKVDAEDLEPLTKEILSIARSIKLP